MARGRGGSNDFGVDTRRRYMSVDPELELSAARRSQRVANHMNDDADFLSHKSRNKDKDLLNDITQRLGNNAYIADPYFRSKYGPTYPSSTNYSASYVDRTLPESPLFIIAGARRGASVPPLRRKIEVYDDERPKKRPPPPPTPIFISPPKRHIPISTVHHKRPRRAASEPPPYRPQIHASVPYRRYSREAPAYASIHYGGKPPVYSSRDPYYYHSVGAPYYSSYVPHYNSHVPYYNDHVPYYNRHVPYYNDHVPYIRRYPRYLDDDIYAEAEMPVYKATYGHYSAPSHSEAVRNARRHLEGLERELGMQNGPVIDEPSVIVHHVHAGPTARVVGSHPPRASYRVAVPPVAGASVRRRSSSLPGSPSPRGVPRRSRVADIEAYYEDIYGFDRELVNPTRVRRSAPVEVVTISASSPVMPRRARVAPSVSPVLSRRPPRMPSLDRHRPHQGTISSADHVAPYKPTSTHQKPPSGAGYGVGSYRQSFRPKVSDTRQRIRDVICHTKHDPHYYD